MKHIALPIACAGLSYIAFEYNSVLAGLGAVFAFLALID